MSNNVNESWICFQIGAREHYAIPRALHRTKKLGRLVTDYWSDGGLAARLQGKLSKSLLSRFHPELSNSEVIHFNSGLLKLEAESRLIGRTGWEAIEKRNEWFQSVAATQLKQFLQSTENGNAEATKTNVFSFSYGAREIFKVAKAAGLRTVLGQIDPGPFEWELVDQLHRSHRIQPLLHPSQTYWDNWAIECELADKIVVNSEWARNALIQRSKTDSIADKIEIVPLVYELPDDATPKATPSGLKFSSQRKLQVLYLGQIIARKGVIEMMDAIELLENSPVEWTVVGSGDPELCDQLSNMKHVRFAGQVDRSQVVEFYKAADVFILPTHSDGYAITQLEAAAFGLPVIAPPFCGEVVTHEENGLLLPEVTGAAIEEAIQRLLTEDKLFAELVEGQRSRKFFNLNDLSEALRAF